MIQVHFYDSCVVYVCRLFQSHNVYINVTELILSAVFISFPNSIGGDEWYRRDRDREGRHPRALWEWREGGRTLGERREDMGELYEWL